MRSAMTALFVLIPAAFSTALRAADAPAEMRKRYVDAQQAAGAGIRLLQEKKFEEAIAKLQEADKLVPGQGGVLYNLACALSRAGRSEEALDTLERSIKAGFIDHKHMQADPDLEAVRENKRFKELVKLAERLGKPKEPLVHVPDGYDRGGKRTYPLLITLHGAGGTPNSLLAAARQGLGADKFFLLAPFGSVRMGPGYTWSSPDFTRIPELVAELKKKYRIGRVYLHGYSAGGHVGYLLVLKNPKVFDGFIPMAGALRRGMVSDAELKNAVNLPIFAIQGAVDAVVPLKAAEQSLELLRQNGALTHLFKHEGGHTPPPNYPKVLADAVKWIDLQKGEE